MTNRDRVLLAKRFALLFGLWLALTGGRADGLAFGLAAAAGGTLLSAGLAPPARIRLRLLRLAALAPGFLWRSLAGGVDVARRALHPRLPIRPGWVFYRPRLPQGTSRVALGAELSLMPGTLVAGTEADRLLVHCLDIDLPVVDSIRHEEERLERAVEQ